MSTLTLPPKFERPTMPVRKFSVPEYHRMISAGVLTENDPVELLEGWIVPKMPHNPLHDSTVQWIDDRLRLLLPSGWCIRIQMAITLDDSEPEPDVVLALGSSKSYRRRHPGPADIGLVIEVAESTLLSDRGEKARIYSRAGLPVYWIVNLVDQQVEVLTQPSAKGTYRKKIVARSHQAISLLLDSHRLSVPVSDLLESTS